MTVKHASVTVGTSAVSLTSGLGASGGTRAQAVVLTNEGSATVYIGGSNVTTDSYGYKLVAGGELAMDVAGDEPFAVAASGSNAVRVLGIGI